MTKSPETTTVLVVGAGPVGLTLALELDRYGINTLLVEQNETTTRHPKMDITNARSMEIYRRLGIADDLRKVATAASHRTRVTWATNGFGWELASFEYPSVDEQREIAQVQNDGTAATEPAMRVSQVVLEPALRGLLDERAEHVTVDYGWRFDSYREDADGVVAVLVSPDGTRRTVRADYLVGTDGAGSRVRKQLGVALDEVDLRRLMLKELGAVRMLRSLVRNYRAIRQRPMDGRFYLVHFKTSDRRMYQRFGTFWHLQSPEGWTVISQNDLDTFTMHTPLGIGTDAEAIDPKEFIYERLGGRFDVEILLANAWTPRLTVADSFGRGRVWLAGDAVHQVPPTGGYGMNTGVGDAAGLGWVLAAQVHGWGTPGLFTAYDQERRSVALRNRDAAGRHAVVRAAVMTSNWTGMNSDSWAGALTRKKVGRRILDLGNLENESDGIEFGYRYDSSPIVCHETGLPPALRADEYTPSTAPGSRPPNVSLEDGSAIFDLFSTGFTLLRFAEIEIADFADAAAKYGIPFSVVDVRDPRARSLYERDLVLVRPDQHVAWRGDRAPKEPQLVMERIRGVSLTQEDHL